MVGSGREDHLVNREGAIGKEEHVRQSWRDGKG